MAVRIIEDTERLKVEVSGSVFYYRRPSIKVQADVHRAYTDSTGQTDFLGMALQTMEACLVGWDQVYGGGETQLLFDKLLIKDLPASVVSQIFTEIMAEDKSTVEAFDSSSVKNSESISG